MFYFRHTHTLWRNCTTTNVVFMSTNYKLIHLNVCKLALWGSDISIDAILGNYRYIKNIAFFIYSFSNKYIHSFNFMNNINVRLFYKKYWCKMIFHLQYKKGRNKKKTQTTHTLSTILICLRCNKSLSVWIFMITYCQIKTIRPISSIRIDPMKKKIWKLFFSADNNILQKYAQRVRHFLATTGFKAETWTLQKHPLYSYQLTYLFSGTIRTTSCLDPVCKMQSLTLSDMSAMWNRIPHAVKNNIQYNINYTRSNQQK